MNKPTNRDLLAENRAEPAGYTDLDRYIDYGEPEPYDNCPTGEHRNTEVDRQEKQIEQYFGD